MRTDTEDEDWVMSSEEESGESEDHMSDDEPLPTQFCVCANVEEHEEEIWVQCSGPVEACPGNKWYHLACVKLTAVPKGKWFCTWCKDA